MDFVFGKANDMAFKVLLLLLQFVCYRNMKKMTTVYINEDL